MGDHNSAGAQNLNPKPLARQQKERAGRMRAASGGGEASRASRDGPTKSGVFGVPAFGYCGLDGSQSRGHGLEGA